MKWLLQPSLSRRIALFEAATFLSLMVVLTAVGMIRFFLPHDGVLDVQRKIVIDSIATSIAPRINNEQFAGAIQAAELILDGWRHPETPIPARVLIWDHDRRLLHADEALRDMPFIESGVGFSDLTWNGHSYRIVMIEKQGFFFALADPTESMYQNFISHMAHELAINLGVSFPISLVVLMIAIYTGLRPLRELGHNIENRHPDDLSPLGNRLPYLEMLPLTNALDSLFARLRKKISLEKSFVHDAAHEMQTPLAVISNQIHVLASADSHEARAEARSSAEQAIQRNSHLVRQLLDLAQLDAERKIGNGALNLAALARDIVAHLTPKAGSQSIDIELQAPDTLLVDGDRNAFYAIISNLVDNAIRYIGAGGRILIELGCTEDCLFLNVIDDGPGIPEAERERVFDRFYRVASRLDDRRGSGLGLAIVKQAVLRMTGSITLGEGLEGRGCAFRIAIPLRDGTRDHPAAKS